MKAAVLKDNNKPLEVLNDVQCPALKRGQVLVKLAFSGVCHSQLMEIKGYRGDDPYLPHLLGHEGSGKVLQVGEGVTKVKPGDWVILGWIKGHGLDGGATSYLSQSVSKELNAGAVTTFNEMSVVSENRLVPLPAGIPLDVAVLFGCAIPTGAGILTNDIQPEKGASLAIFGMGGIGLSALMASKLYQCDKVIAVDINEEKLSLAASFGATHVINAKTNDPVKKIMSITGCGVDYSIEASSLTNVIEQAFNSVRQKGGLCVFASHPKHGNRIQIDPFDLICGKQIRGSWGGNCHPDIDIPKFAQLYREGKLPLEKLITKKYSLDNINEAITDLEHYRAVRPIIEINKELSEEYSKTIT